MRDILKIFIGNSDEKSRSRNIQNDLFTIENSTFKDAKKTCNVIVKHGFSKKALNLIKNNNLKLRNDLQITDIEYLTLAFFISRLGKGFIVDDFIDICSGNTDVALPLYNTLFNLYERNLVSTRSAFADVEFYASSALTDYLQTGVIKQKEPLSLRSAIIEIDIIANLFNNYEAVSDIGGQQILNLLNENSQYEFCQKLLEVFNDDKIGYTEFLFYITCHLIIRDHLRDENKIDKDSSLIEAFCKHKQKRIQIIDDIFSNDKHPLIEAKIFDHSIDESGKADRYTIEIHSEFKRKYLLDVLKEKKFDEVIISNNITEKDMFYNENNSKQILDLASILEKERFDEVKTRLKEAGTRSGFVCLFSGCAGTGKTETVFQIARKTGRNIIKIDMSALRSKWWGEDEKNVKAVFTNYKSVLQESRIEPILLLNEADAIIGKRLNIEGHNGAIITAINATQNIILEELENFEGIMIATTNLTKNFDSAFERRFLYKIEFEKPDRENRIKLWKYIAKLDEEKADILTEKFKDFTGAQIENIYRKIITDIVLYGNEIQIEKIIEFCKNETISNDKIIIGFESGK